jgi:hypothetical protein
MVTKSFTVRPNVRRSSLWNFLRMNLEAPRLFECYVGFLGYLCNLAFLSCLHVSKWRADIPGSFSQLDLHQSFTAATRVTDSQNVMFFPPVCRWMETNISTPHNSQVLHLHWHVEALLSHDIS